MKKSLIAILAINLCYAQNVGINTSTPDPSAILELNADPPEGSLITGKKGFLPPRVGLSGINDITTIPNPANGVLVFNTVTQGVDPNQVFANNFYYWNGTNWEGLAYTSLVEEAVKPRVFYIESNGNQTFTSADMNIATGIPSDNLVTFTIPMINVKNIITFNSANSTFTANVTGLYEFSSFVNYNPMATTTGVPSNSYQKRAFLNLKIQKSINNGTTWTNEIGSRTAWGEDGAGELKTAILLGTPLRLNQGDQIRMVISNPFNSSGSNDHCGAGNCYIAADPANNIPTSKGLIISLLDFNIN
ncbi:hypothetical protein HHL23_13580 [Chryseobacterium sp. RP-3-3]|uniref:Uncharacterized protein n=1 Tax=Chryseobacterium antibioticum TaxID=2728847 RepID=A0A7Y0ANW8_9FLAO|nr:hypothetical protein [Chryseobacterium antibioticum]NML70818.1 hypothetical protein [Chryseobacterium antibioticum]